MYDRFGYKSGEQFFHNAFEIVEAIVAQVAEGVRGNRSSSCADDEGRLFLDSLRIAGEDGAHLEQAQVVDLAIQVVGKHGQHSRYQ